MDIKFSIDSILSDKYDLSHKSNQQREGVDTNVRLNDYEKRVLESLWWKRWISINWRAMLTHFCTLNHFPPLYHTTHKIYKVYPSTRQSSNHAKTAAPRQLISMDTNTFVKVKNCKRQTILRRSVFTEKQRRDLEITFQKEKYINKTERKGLADKLGLKDSQVKIWFQNRRMKWRNAAEKLQMSMARNHKTQKIRSYLCL